MKDPIKIILLGESGVGKTNLIKVSTGGLFDEDSAPSTSSSCNEGTIRGPDNNIYKYFLWDTAGQEYYRSMNNIFMKNAKIILLVFALNSNYTFKEIDYWYKRAESNNSDYVIALVGNKIDLIEEQEVTEDMVKAYAKKNNNMKYLLTSAKDDPEGIKSFVKELILDYLKLYQGMNDKVDSFQLKKKKKESERIKKGFC